MTGLDATIARALSGYNCEIGGKHAATGEGQ